MKLMLAMGLQYDTSKPDHMFALSLGGNSPAVAKSAVSSVLAEIEPDINIKTPATIPRKQQTPFFLTYNLHGLRDTLLVDTGAVDLFV